MPHDHSSHFKGKEALEHVIEAQAGGLLSSSEVHGTESPGYLSAACDAARETAVLLVILSLIFISIEVSAEKSLVLLLIFSGSLVLWKLGRAAWLGWFRLERLHRVLDQERFEIEHHRQQERDELRVLYAAKGFEGKLLEDVLDVLMADNARLLKVMIEEELGLSLATHEHPLKQGLGAASGTCIAAAICIAAAAILPWYGIVAAGALILAGSAYLFSYLNSNEPIPAIVWNLGLAAISVGWVYFLLQWFSNGTF